MCNIVRDSDNRESIHQVTMKPTWEASDSHRYRITPFQIATVDESEKQKRAQKIEREKKKLVRNIKITSALYME